MKLVNILTLVLVVVGAVNWGLVGLFQFDLVAAIFGGSKLCSHASCMRWSGSPVCIS